MGKRSKKRTKEKKEEIGNEATQFKTGNVMWMRTPEKDRGRDPTFDNPDEMWNDAVKYFQWTVDNPHIDIKPFIYLGRDVSISVPKMRAMTLRGMYRHMNIVESTWLEYRKKTVFSRVIEDIDAVIYEQKFTGAAAGLLNGNIIARDLGLVDKTEQKVDSKVGLYEGLSEAEQEKAMDRKTEANNRAIAAYTES